MNVPDLLALRPLALGHDQEASACHWAQLTHRTTDYPSRRAQLALALAAGAVPATPDVAALLYRCDDCRRCLAHAILPQPPDLSRALWPVRAWLVEQGVVPELGPLRERLERHGHVCGDLRGAWERLGPGDLGATTLFVPDGAVLAADPVAACAALRVVRRVAGPVALLAEAPDSGRVLRELGLAAEADRSEALVLGRIAAAGFRRVLAGTPKEAGALAEMLAGIPVQAQYVGSALAEAVLAGRVDMRDGAAVGRRVVLHPSASLLRAPAQYALITRWLDRWLGDGFCPEPDAERLAWPAAIERPAIGLNPALARALAQARLEALVALGPDLILTCEPFSRRALREAAPAAIEVVDLLAFAGDHLAEANA
jgi:hypothetical protein